MRLNERLESEPYWLRPLLSNYRQSGTNPIEVYITVAVLHYERSIGLGREWQGMSGNGQRIV